MIPSNVLRVVAAVSQHGPLSPEAVAALLRQDGVVLHPATLARLPDRYPAHLGTDGVGRICLPQPGQPSESYPADDTAPATPRVSAPLEPGQIWVAGETADTPGTVNLRSLTGGRLTVGDAPDGTGVPSSGGVEDVAMVICDARDRARLPQELAALAPDPVVVAWQELAALVAVDQPYESVDDALTWVEAATGVDPAAVDRILSVVRGLLEQVDLDEPNWSLTLHALHAAGSPWARVLGADPGEVDVATALRPRIDPLLEVPAAGRAPFSAAAGTAEALQVLSQQAGIRTRAGQHEMAQAVATALDSGGTLVVEAPTGTGKTLAYLAPAAARAARSNAPVVVATHTKVLQRQIRAEVEWLRALGLFNAPFRQLFGVSNYVCAREVSSQVTAVGGGAVLDQGRSLALAVAIRALAVSPNGVWDDAADNVLIRTVPGYLAGRRSLAVETDDCAGAECPAARHCPLIARRGSGDRHRPGVIATNHALVASLATAGHGESLFGSESEPASLIFDEAHRLEDSLTSAWTEETGSLPLRALQASMGPRGRYRQAVRFLERLGIDTAWRTAVDAVVVQYRPVEADLAAAVVAYLYEYTSDRESVEVRRGVVDARPEYARVRDAAIRLAQLLGQARKSLEEASHAIREHTGSSPGGLHDAWRALASLHRRHEVHESLLWAIVGLEGGSTIVHLLGVQHLAGEPVWTFKRVPVEVGPRFREVVVDPAHATVLTSATLRVAGGFDFITSRLGLPEGTRALALASPFDFDAQSIVVMASHLPVPIPANEEEFVEEMAADTAGFLSLSRGRTLSLFAATRRMTGVAERLAQWEGPLAERGVHVLVQGDHSPGEIQRRFRSDPGTALLGVQSYWEGFDAPGETLSFLQIEKAPYPPPDEPITAARSRLVMERGGNPFLDYVVPRTALAMTQGYGRLIRTETDRGAAMILDRRLQAPTVANQMILTSLPTRNIVYARDRSEAWVRAIGFVDGVEPDPTSALDIPGTELESTLEQFSISSGEDPGEKLAGAARAIFGIDALHPEQVQMMTALLAARDVVGILPTGTGKSLVFQLPTLLRADRMPTVVISPLVALIKDQVDDLRSRRGLRMVAGITGRTSGAERTELLRDLATGRLRLLYVSPERMVSDVALRTALATRDLGLLVVDEAHCISAWGHDFRPEFRQIARSTRQFRRSPRLALTATATPEVTDDIVRSLEMRAPLVIRRPVARPDLRYRAIEVGSDRERVREILRLHAHQPDAYGLVYVSRRALAEEVAWLLRQAGISARAYHAGMDPEQRESVQDDFLSGGCRIVVATNAFGMGVNKPDISWVVHFDPPQSLEAYAQEAGRAARAIGMTGDSVLLHRPGDLVRVRRLIGSGADREHLTHATTLWDRLRSGTDTTGRCSFSAEDFCAELGLEPDELSVTLGWLEATGHLERLPDQMAAGMISLGVGEPEDSTERQLYLQVTLAELSLRPMQARRIASVAELADRVGLTTEALGEALIRWTLARYVSFQPTQRRSLVQLHRSDVDRPALERAVESWRQAQLSRLRQVERFLATAGQTCRRVSLAATFGDDRQRCLDIPGAQACDFCDPARAPWHAVPLDRVPDLEKLIDIDGVVLNAVRWSEGFIKGHYAEAGLRLALLGHEAYPSGRPLGRGLLACPQFGAFKYLRGADRRLGESIEGLCRSKQLERVDVGYPTLTLTETARRDLSGLPGSRHASRGGR